MNKHKNKLEQLKNTHKLNENNYSLKTIINYIKSSSSGFSSNITLLNNNFIKDYEYPFK